MKREYIACSQLLNNYSGSPFVLSQVVKVLNSNNISVRLYIGNKKGEGFLSDSLAIKKYSFYRFCGNKLLRLFFVFAAEFHILFIMLFTVKKENCKLIYANTLYSFGTAIAGKIKRIPVVYHIHETYLSPKLLRWFLQKIVQLTATKTVFVSKYHENVGKIETVPSRVVYNCINARMFDEAKNFIYSPIGTNAFNILMISSLKSYKGINEFMQLVTNLSNQTKLVFHLLLNCTEEEFIGFNKRHGEHKNLTLHKKTNDVRVLLKKTNLLLSLTQPDKVIETFGLTLLEAMTFGIPVIAPPVGGPTELVDDGVNGYLISCYEIDTIANKIVELSENPALCLKLSDNAREKAKQFSPEAFEKKILELINEI